MDGMQGMKEGKALSEPITDADSGLWKRKAVRRGFGVGLGGDPQSHVCFRAEGEAVPSMGRGFWSCVFTLESPDRSHFPRCFPAAFSSHLSKGLASSMQQCILICSWKWMRAQSSDACHFGEGVQGPRGAGVYAALLLSCFSQAGSYIY